MVTLSGPRLAWLLAALGVAGVAQDDRGVSPGRFLIDPPTLENLGFRWYIEGDSNRNASVRVSYRKKGRPAWRRALPLLRVHHEVVNQAFGPYRVGNLFAGSVLFLEPATSYEVRLEMNDPDGGSPPPKTVTVSTRAEPRAWGGGRKLHVYPAGHLASRPPGAFDDLAAAFQSALPGDHLLLHGGIYRATEPWELTRSGEPGKPIVLRAAGDGEPILEGPGHDRDLFRIAQADHLMFEDLTLRRARFAIYAGEKGGPGASGLTVRRCRIENVVYGIWNTSENADNWHISDNVITGINPQWYPRPSDGSYMKPAHTGVNVYGRGHVVCRNRIARFSDSLAIANFGIPVPDPERHAVAIDFYQNDLSDAQDDTLETDYGCHNIRVYRNRCYNAHTGLSAQPLYGGPVYLIRNELFGIASLTLKWHNYCAGLLAYHNTLACAGAGFRSFDRWQNGHLRNNLFLGGRGPGEPQPAMTTGTITPYSTLDYNGYRDNGAANLIRWFDGVRETFYRTLADFSRATGHERHGLTVDYGIFRNAAPPLAGRSYHPAEWDLSLKPGSVAVDAGEVLPNVNDGFRGKAPDLGCFELDAPLPRYGPRGRRAARSKGGT